MQEEIKITRGSGDVFKDLGFSEAKTILMLIEKVDPADERTLDEIDARVVCYRNGIEFRKILKASVSKGESTPRYGIFIGGQKAISNLQKHHKYTRSRDALKAIRPEVISIRVWTDKYGQAFCCINDNEKSCMKSPMHPYLPTEYLAELHAIVQLVEYMRNNVAG